MPSGPAALDLLPRLEAALSGEADALLPHPAGRDPDPALRPGEPLDAAEDDPADPTVAVVATSGSTGTPRGVLLPASALLTSASATHDRLGGSGRWLLALPAHHVAGLAVLVRSLVAGTRPVAVHAPSGFTPEAFLDAASRLRGTRRYTSLVPTQLVRLLAAGGAVAEALAAFDAVLVGGAALPDRLRERAAEAGVRVVETYGMTETCGGCVYDGVPLGGVTVTLDPLGDAGPGEGRIRIGGPVVGRGYRPAGAGAGAGAADGDLGDGPGGRWVRTGDLGALDSAGRLRVLGRIDDVIVTGGVKVAPRVVESALLELPEVAEAVVIGLPDPEWGSIVVAAVVPSPGARPALDTLRDAVGRRVGRHAAPRRFVLLDTLPLLGPGKPDRARLAELAADEYRP